MDEAVEIPFLLGPLHGATSAVRAADGRPPLSIPFPVEVAGPGGVRVRHVFYYFLVPDNQGRVSDSCGWLYRWNGPAELDEAAADSHDWDAGLRNLAGGE